MHLPWLQPTSECSYSCGEHCLAMFSCYCPVLTLTIALPLPPGFGPRIFHSMEPPSPFKRTPGSIHCLSRDPQRWSSCQKAQQALAHYHTVAVWKKGHLNIPINESWNKYFFFSFLCGFHGIWMCSDVGRWETMAMLFYAYSKDGWTSNKLPLKHLATNIAWQIKSNACLLHFCGWQEAGRIAIYNRITNPIICSLRLCLWGEKLTCRKKTFWTCFCPLGILYFIIYKKVTSTNFHSGISVI